MRIQNQFVAVGLSLKENEGKEGNKFYQVAIDQDGECGTLPCTEDVFSMMSKGFFDYVNDNNIMTYSLLLNNLEHDDVFLYHYVVNNDWIGCWILQYIMLKNNI